MQRFSPAAQRSSILGLTAWLALSVAPTTLLAQPGRAFASDPRAEIGMENEYVELPGVTRGPVITVSQAHGYEFFSRHSR